MLEALPPSTMKYFPYAKVRPSQDKFIKFVYEAVSSGNNICIEGPNGLGKTIAVLSAVLPIAIKNDLGILYCARTHRECDRVIAELNAINRKKSVSGASLRSRKDMCIHPLLVRRAMTSREALDFCEQLRENDMCELYWNLKTHPSKVEKIQKMYESKPASAAEIISLSKREKLCPYELAKLLLGRADVIALTYYYVFDPVIKGHFFKYLRRQPREHILILDEAHNLPAISIEIASDSLSLSSIQRAYKESIEYGYRDIAPFFRLLGNLVRELSRPAEEEILIDPSLFIEALQSCAVTGEIIHFLDYIKDVGRSIRSDLLQRNEFPRSYVDIVGKFLLNWIETAGDSSFTHVLSSRLTKEKRPSLRLEIVALDPRNITKPVLSSVYCTVSTSGTLDPTQHYAKIVGLPEETTRHETVPSPFPPENILPLACKGVTTSLEHRSPTMYRKLARRCAEVVRYTPANVGIFAPSYEVLEGVLEANLEGLIEKPLFVERQDMSSRENASLIRNFKSFAEKGGAVLFGVQGGRSSEGLDYPGNEMNSVVVLGVPYAKPSPTVNAQIQFYENTFPGHGEEFGYLIPAMRRASQAAGRPIRSLEDKGAIIFMDHRFSTAYCKRYIPGWMRRYMRTVEDEDGALAKELILFFGLQSIS